MEETGGSGSWGTEQDARHKRLSQAEGPMCTQLHAHLQHIHIACIHSHTHIYTHSHVLTHKHTYNLVHTHIHSHKTTCLVSHKEQGSKLSRLHRGPGRGLQVQVAGTPQGKLVVATKEPFIGDQADLISSLQGHFIGSRKGAQ